MGPHRVGWPIVTSRYCKLQSLRPLLSALAGVGRVIRLESSWICSLANPPRARREQKPSLSCAFRRILLLVMRFLVPSADREFATGGRIVHSARRLVHAPLERSDPLTCAGNMVPTETVSAREPNRQVA